MVGLHWMTYYDKDGEPVGMVCSCEIKADHFASGKLMEEQ